MNKKILQRILLTKCFCWLKPAHFLSNIFNTGYKWSQDIEISIYFFTGEIDKLACRKLRKLLGEGVANEYHR